MSYLYAPTVPDGHEHTTPAHLAEMGLHRCRGCGVLISQEANCCPHCGAYQATSTQPSKLNPTP